MILVVAGEDYYVYLVTDENEVEVLRKLHKFDKNATSNWCKNENWINGGLS